MRIGFATADWAVRAMDRQGNPSYGGAGWARMGLPAKYLGEEFEVAEGALAFDPASHRFLVRRMTRRDPFGKAVELEDLAAVDVIVLQRWMLPEAEEHTIDAIRHGQVVLNDVDDHFWALDKRNQAAAASDPKLHPEANRDLYLRSLKVCSAVTVSTPFLASELRKLGVRVPIHVIENAVELSAFAQVRSDRLYRGRPVLGWVGGTPWRSGDLQELRGLLGPFLEHENLLAYHGGHIERPGVRSFAHEAGVDPRRMLTAGMVPIDEYPSLMAGLDIGLVPLRDAPFNRAKSWIKGIEYAAAGIPFVASDLPEYRRLRDVHGIGRVARKASHWLAHWRELLPVEARQEEAARNLAAVKALDITNGIERWREVYRLVGA